MSHIDLSSITSNVDKKDNIPIENNSIKDKKPIQEPRIDLKPEVEKPVKENKVVVKETAIEVKKVTLTPNEKAKIIAIIQLYIAEFPDKLKKYKSKNLDKMSDEDLIELKSTIHKEAISTNSLSMLTENSGKMLLLYEHLMCDYVGVNVKGVSNIANSEEYKACVKALLLKHMGDSLISSVEPEYQLLYMIVCGSVMAHANNEMLESNTKVAHIEDNNSSVDASKLRELNEKFRDL